MSDYGSNSIASIAKMFIENLLIIVGHLMRLTKKSMRAIKLLRICELTETRF